MNFETVIKHDFNDGKGTVDITINELAKKYDLDPQMLLDKYIETHDLVQAVILTIQGSSNKVDSNKEMKDLLGLPSSITDKDYMAIRELYYDFMSKKNMMIESLKSVVQNTDDNKKVRLHDVDYLKLLLFLSFDDKHKRKIDDMNVVPDIPSLIDVKTIKSFLQLMEQVSIDQSTRLKYLEELTKQYKKVLAYKNINLISKDKYDFNFNKYTSNKIEDNNYLINKENKKYYLKEKDLSKINYNLKNIKLSDEILKIKNDDLSEIEYNDLYPTKKSSR